MTLRCLLGWHAWLPWTNHEEGKIGRRRTFAGSQIGEPVEVGTYIVQKRQCAACGRLALRTVETSL